MPVNCKKIPAPLLKDVTIFFINLATFVGLEERLQRKSCYAEDVLKTSLRHVLKTCPEGVRRLGDKQNVYWEYLYLANLNLYLINLYLTYLYLTNQGESKMH